MKLNSKLSSTVGIALVTLMLQGCLAVSKKAGAPDQVSESKIDANDERVRPVIKMPDGSEVDVSESSVVVTSADGKRIVSGSFVGEGKSEAGAEEIISIVKGAEQNSPAGTSLVRTLGSEVRERVLAE